MYSEITIDAFLDMTFRFKKYILDELQLPPKLYDFSQTWWCRKALVSVYVLRNTVTVH